MALVKLRTKSPVVIDSMTGETSVVYMDVDSVTVEDSGYTSTSTYRVNFGESKKVIKTESRFFTRAQSTQLFTYLGAQGSNFDEQLYNLIPKVALYRLGVAGYWGLTSNDWEIDNDN